MQWSGAVLVLGIHMSPGVEQTADGLHLSLRVPSGVDDVTVGRVVQGAALPMIPGRVGVSPGRQQQSNDLNTVTRGRQVQRRISDVNPVRDRRFVQFCLIDTAGGDSAVCLEEFLHRRAVVIEYGSK